MPAAEDYDATDEGFLTELRAAREGDRRRPDFFVVGHAKCGTTALCRMLDAHPQIFMSTPKETQFLSRSPRLIAAHAAGRVTRRPQTLDAYLDLFAAAAPELRAGEGSTEYLRAAPAAANVAELCPEARIVTAFREPAAFLRSLHLQLLQVGVESEPDLGRALELEADRRAGRNLPSGCPWPPALRYSEHVRYAEQLRRWQERFGAERVLVTIYDDFRADNEAVVRAVFRFLGVDDGVAIAPLEANPTVRVRSRRAEGAVTSLALGAGPLAGAAKSLVKSLTSTRVRRAALAAARRAAVDTTPAPPDDQLMASLRERFRPEVEELGRLIGRDLAALWSPAAPHR